MELIGGKSTHWETQKDQSKALVLEPKQRLKLPLDELKEVAGFFGNLDSYTITVDMKLPESLENQVVSLFPLCFICLLTILYAWSMQDLI